MIKILIICVLICSAFSLEVKYCNKDEMKTECFNEKKSVCGIRYETGQQKRETFLNHCIACMNGHSDFTVTGQCEKFPANAQFCPPSNGSSVGLACTMEYDPQCAWVYKGIGFLKKQCHWIDATNKCEACKSGNALYTKPGKCGQDM